MKRLLVLCGLAALLIVPTAAAGKTTAQPALTPSCSPCLAGQLVTFTGSGFDDRRTYMLNLNADDGYSRYQYLPAASGGQVSFTMVYSPWEATTAHYALTSKPSSRSGSWSTDLTFDIVFQ